MKTRQNQNMEAGPGAHMDLLDFIAELERLEHQMVEHLKWKREDLFLSEQRTPGRYGREPDALLREYDRIVSLALRDKIATIRKRVEHAEKFEGKVRSEDKLTELLTSIVRRLHSESGSFPNWRTVVSELEQLQGQGMIESVTDEGIEWGADGYTDMSSLRNRLTDIKKKIKKG